MRSILAAACVFALQYLFFLRVLKPILLRFARSVSQTMNALNNAFNNW